MLALVLHLSVYIVVLALCRKALAMLVFKRTLSQFIRGSGGPCFPGKFWLSKIIPSAISG